MTGKTYKNILLFSLFGLTMWFFGNLYEAIVIAPNMLNQSLLKTDLWQKFFTMTNPAFFYIPISPIAILTTILLFFKTPNDKTKQKNHLKRATIFGLCAFILGVYIITQINFKLFFGDINELSDNAHRLSVLWNLLNGVRVLFLTFTVYHLFKTYILTEKELK